MANRGSSLLAGTRPTGGSPRSEATNLRVETDVHHAHEHCDNAVKLGSQYAPQFSMCLTLVLKCECVNATILAPLASQRSPAGL